MSGVSMTSKNAIGSSQRRKWLLKASVAVPVAALMLSPAAAVELITVDSPVTVGALNTQIINAMNLPESDITLEIEADGSVTDNGNIQLNSQGADRGDGVIIFRNAGNVGSLLPDSQVIDNVVGVAASGPGSFTGANSGLITGSVNAGFSGAVSFTNTGTLRGSVSLGGNGASLSSAGSIGGSASVTAFSTNTSETVDGVTTSINTGKSASATLANAGSKTARGNVFVSGSTASAEVTGIAGDVNVNAYGTTTTVDGKTAAPAAGKTNTTFDRTVTRTGGAATATIGSTADILNLSVTGTNDAAATVAGKVAGNISVSSGNAFGTLTERNTVTLNADGDLTARTFASTSGPQADKSSATVALAATGTANSLNVSSGGGALTADIAGKIAGNVNLNSTATVFTNSTNETFDVDTKIRSGFDNATTETLQAGKLAFTVATTGQTGQIDANAGTAGIAGAIAGTTGNVFLRANTFVSDNTFTESRDGKTNNFLSSASTFDQGNKGGPIALSVTGKSAFTFLDSATGNSTVTVSGTTGDLQIFAEATRSVGGNTDAAIFDDKGNQIGFSNSGSFGQSGNGGAAAITVDQGGRVQSVFATADGGVDVVNNGTIVASLTARSDRNVQAKNDNSFSETTVADTKQTTTTTLNSGSFQRGAVGGTVSLVNSATGLIGDPSSSVNLNGIGGVTINNDGTIRGGINATSTRNLDGNSFSNKTVSTTVFGVDAAPNVTTTTRNNTSSNSNTAAGGAVDARFAGVVGTIEFSPAVTGNVNLTALGNVKAAVVGGGAIYGSLTQNAGQLNNSSTSNGFDETEVIGDDGKGSFGFSQFSNSTSVREGASLASATIAGRVGRSNTGSGGNVDVFGNTASVAIEGGVVDSNVNVTANGRSATEGKFTQTAAQTTTDFARTTTAVTESNAGKTVNSGGAASFSLTAGKVGGSASVSGVETATATAAAGTTISGGLVVNSGTTNSEFLTNSAYTRDSKGVVAASTSTRNVSTAVVGNSTATVAGVVGNTGGSLNVSSSTGNATAALTGRVGNSVTGFTGNVTVDAAFGTVSDGTTTDTTAGKLAASGNTFFGGLGLPGLGSGLATGVSFTRTVASTTTATGGTASLTIETPAAAQATGTVAVNGSVNVRGLAGSTASVAAGSIVNGSVNVGTIRTNSTFNSTDAAVGTALGTQRNLTSTTVNTAVGGASTLTNAGKIAGTASVTSVTTAALTNSGRAGGLSASAVGFDTTTTVVDNRIDSSPLRVRTVTDVTTARLGVASITNAAGAVAGSVNVAGATGTVTNAGFITGTTTLGQSLNLGTRVDERTDGTQSFTYTAPAMRAVQTYTMDQNSISRAIRVEGATLTVTNPFTGAPQTVQTSDINATINLNSGSVTLGDITAQVSPTNAFLTNTTVNLRGSGWLGADLAGLPVQRTPNLSLPIAAQAEFGTGAGNFVAVRGVNLLRKQDAGTFVIAGQNFVAATTTTPAAFTLDVGNFAIDGGEVQLARPTGVGTFGIRGNVTNAATLVLGRRVPVNPQAVGDSLVTVGPERILGLTVNQTGNFTQTANGTLVVGATGALTRFTPASVGTSGASSELLGPVTGGVAIPYFTSPTNAALTPTAGSTPSRIDVTGDLNLAGTVRVTVSRDSIFRDGDGTTLATYTGTGTVTATAASTITSPFVSFRVVNDAATRTVRLVSSRASYATAAQGANAQAAATALNSAIPAITTAILSDATGGAAFGTVRALANAQDVANVVNALDWRLTAAQAAQVFNELSSGEIYASISAVDQNVALNSMRTVGISSLLAGQPMASRLWASPVGDFSRFDGDETAGASGIRSSSYGVAFGGDVAFADDGMFSVGASYGEHDVSARGTPESARIRTWTIGANITKGFGNAYVQGSVAYGFSRFSVDRDLTLLARSMGSDFRGTQLDAALEAGYRFEVGGNWNITPFASAAIRNWETNEAVEADGSVGGGFALRVAEASKSIFRPTIGARVAGQFGSSNGLVFRPLLNVSYTFQGDIGAARSMQFAGGGDAFTVRGFSPDGFGTVELGVDTVVKEKVNLFLRGGYSFGGGNNAPSIRAGLGFNF